MKFLKFLIISFIVIGGLGYGVYHYGTNYISDQITETVSAEIEYGNNVEEIKDVVNSHPEIKSFIEDGANVDESELPFTTIDEASKVIVKKVGLGKLQEMQTKYENGISQNEVNDILQELEGKLTEEEMLAIKAIAYKKLYK